MHQSMLPNLTAPGAESKEGIERRACRHTVRLTWLAARNGPERSLKEVHSLSCCSETRKKMFCLGPATTISVPVIP
eukprot:2908104-Rhodomonas_salina.2